MLSLQSHRHRRQTYGNYGASCNLLHNLMSTLALLPVNLRTTVDSTVHWARQNYEKDHEANVWGTRCGHGKSWQSDMTLHSLPECGWLSKSGNLICSNYEKDTNHGLNEIKSYCELAIKTTCRCVPSWGLLKHGSLRDASHYGHSLGTQCSF